MKRTSSNTVSNKGVLFIQTIINDQGSIFRSVHQETDIGVDGFIELIYDKNSTGRLIACQIKSGDSYLAKSKKTFKIKTDKKHLDYWNNLMVPVIIIGYSPSLDVASWIYLKEYCEFKKSNGIETINTIEIPVKRKFDINSINNELRKIANTEFDERLLIICADNCYSNKPTERYQGFLILTNHPTSRDNKLTIKIAKDLIMDEEIQIAKRALYVLGYGVGRMRWSWNSANIEEQDLINFACEVCENLTENEIHRLIELVDKEHFNGPDALGERCYDVMGCCSPDIAIKVLKEIIRDNSLYINRRFNALLLLYDINIVELKEKYINKDCDESERDILKWYFGK